MARKKDPTLAPILVYIDRDVRRLLNVKAARRGTTVSAIVREKLAEVVRGER